MAVESPTALVCLVTSTPLLTAMSFLYIVRVRTYPIRCQWPGHLISIIPFVTFFSIIPCVKRLDPGGLPRPLYDMLVLTCATYMVTVVCMRCWKLFINYYFNVKLLRLRADAEVSSTNHVRRATWHSLPMWLRLCHWFFAAGILWVATAALLLFWLLTCNMLGVNKLMLPDQEHPFSRAVLLAICGFNTANILIFAVLIYHVTNRMDSLNITRQLLFAGLMMGVPGVGWMLTHANPNWEIVGGFDMRLILGEIMWLGGWTSLVGWPVYQSYSYERKHGKKLPVSSADILGRAKVRVDQRIRNPDISKPKSRKIEAKRSIRSLFDHVLESPEEKEKFRCFLQGEFCVENLVFWEAAENYRNMCQHMDMGTPLQQERQREMAHSIYAAHLTHVGLYQVNLPDSIVEHVEDILMKFGALLAPDSNPPREKSSSKGSTKSTISRDIPLDTSIRPPPISQKTPPQRQIFSGKTPLQLQDTPKNLPDLGAPQSAAHQPATFSVSDISVKLCMGSAPPAPPIPFFGPKIKLPQKVISGGLMEDVDSLNETHSDFLDRAGFSGISIQGDSMDELAGVFVEAQAFVYELMLCGPYQRYANGL